MRERGRLGRRLAAVALAGAAVGTLAPAAMAAPAPADARRGGVDARAELRAFVADGSSTAAFAEVREDGRRIWRDAVGTSDLATGQPVRPD
ncbi:hypothetical protein VR45_17045, partial [Streptomyces sp. NRRL S-495]